MLRLIALLICCAAPVRAEEALVAVAANFAATADALATEFNTDTGHSVQITTGSTGKLFAQIMAGAPYDAMLSADAATPARLQAAGHGTPQPYAFGILTLWLPNGPHADPLRALQTDQTRHIAIANPELAPYGAATVAALHALGLYEEVTDKIVMGQNVGQAFALVQSGAAEAGFIARSALPADAKGTVYEIPPTLHPPIQQDAILLQHGHGNAAALGFLAYLATPKARAAIAAAGYGLP